MYLMKCVVFLIVLDYISADSEVITEVSFNISINNNITTCKYNPVRGLVAQRRFRVSAASNDIEFAANVATCSFKNTTQNPMRFKLDFEDNKHRSVTSEELHFKPEMDGHQLICELGLNMSQNPDNNNNLAHDRRNSTVTCVMDIHLEITNVSFNISMEDNNPTCTENPVRGPIIAKQKFQVSATTKDKRFAYNNTICFFNNTPQNRIRLKHKDENSQFVASDELYFKPEMDGHQLICKLGLQIERNDGINNSDTLDSHDRRSSTATCVMSINLGTDGSSENNEIDYKMLMIIGFSLASVFLIICLAQSVALCIFVPKGRFRKKKGERINTDSIISDSGTIYEELKPVPEDIETVTVDKSDKQPGKCLTKDSPRPEKKGKKGIKAMFTRSPKSHPPPVTESTLPDPPHPENNGKKGIMARFAKSPKSHPPPVTESALPDPPQPENNGKKGIMARFAKGPKSHPPPVIESALPDPPHPENDGKKKGIMARFARSPKSHPPPVTESALPDPPRPEKNGKKGTMTRFPKASPEHHLSLVNSSTLNLPEVNASSARPHVFQEEIYSNEYVPEPTSVQNKAPPRPPKPNNRLKPPVAKKLIRQQKLEGNCPSPVKSSKRISEMVSKLEGHLQPAAVAQKLPVTTVVKPKKNVVTSEQHVPVQHHAWSPPPRIPVIPTQHHLEDERMDSEDSEDWTYEDLDQIYEMPEP